MAEIAKTIRTSTGHSGHSLESCPVCPSVDSGQNGHLSGLSELSGLMEWSTDALKTGVPHLRPALVPLRRQPGRPCVFDQGMVGQVQQPQLFFAAAIERPKLDCCPVSRMIGAAHG